MFRRFWKLLRNCLLGQRLAQSIERNNRAADRLDALVREALNR